VLKKRQNGEKEHKKQNTWFVCRARVRKQFATAFYSLTTGLDYLLLRCTGTTGGRIQVCVKQQVYIKSEGSLVRGKLFGKSAKNGVNAQN
jgi:hypothetical protein